MTFKVESMILSEDLKSGYFYGIQLAKQLNLKNTYVTGVEVDNREPKIKMYRAYMESGVFDIWYSLHKNSGNLIKVDVFSDIFDGNYLEGLLKTIILKKETLLKKDKSNIIEILLCN